MSLPSVYLIVLNYNTKDTTIGCLESMEHLTYPNVHAVLVDNGSKDDCAEVAARRWPDAKVIALKQNLGYAGGCNVGTQYALEAGADYLIYLGDMVLDPRFVDELVDVAERDSSCGMICPRIYAGYPPSDLVLCDGGHYSLWTGFADGYGRGEKRPRDSFLECREVTFATGCCMVRADVVRKIGMLDEGLFAYAEDMDWSMKALRAGYKIVTAPRSVLWHLEIRATSSAWRFRLATRNMLAVHWRHARWWHCLTAWPYFFVRWLGYMTAREVLHGRFREAAALWKGVADALAGRTGSPPR